MFKEQKKISILLFVFDQDPLLPDHNRCLKCDKQLESTSRNFSRKKGKSRAKTVLEAKQCRNLGNFFSEVACNITF